MEGMIKLPQKPIIYVCKKCDYQCSHKGDWNKHIYTAKHTNDNNGNSSIPKTPRQYKCYCGNEYNHMSGLSRHRKNCNNTQFIEHPINEINQQQLVDYLIKENSEFKQLMLEQNKHMLELAKNSGNHNSHNTTNNNSFNLNVFLNETCKDAMNIMEFVDQLQVSVKDLEETGRLGYAEGISKIFINGLKQINISDRPIHCADSKREIVYIKDKNQWNKEDNNKSLLTHAIKHVAHKNMKQIQEWTKVNPEYKDSSSKQNDRYLKIVSNSMNGLTEEEETKNYNKIIKNITKETVIEK